MGYSMGGGGTLDTSADTASITTYNIAAAVALHPVTTEIMALAEEKGDAYYGDIGIPTIPALILSGSDDITCEYDNILPNFEEQTHAGRALANVSGYGHGGPFVVDDSNEEIPNDEWPNIVEFFNCHLNSLEASCINIYYTGESEMFDNDSAEASDTTCAMCICNDYSIAQCLLGASFGQLMGASFLCVASALYMF
jgi:hypothetical protein